MHIENLKPDAMPAELRVKIEHVMQEKNLTWKAAILFLAREVVPPESGDNADKDSEAFFVPQGETTHETEVSHE